MELRYYHCSVALGSRLLVIGGNVNGKASTSVQAFDASNATGEWVTLDSLLTARIAPSCALDSFQGEQGVFVVSGSNTASVEFYREAANSWRKVNRISEDRPTF